MEVEKLTGRDCYSCMKIGKRRAMIDFFIIFGGMGAIYLVGKWPPVRRGFHCDDETIRYAFEGETINAKLGLLVVVLAGFILILLTEYVKSRQVTRRNNCVGFSVPIWISLAYRNFMEYAYGLIFFGIFVAVMKTAIGSLRPQFIAHCQPNIDLSNCKSYNHSYIVDYDCQLQDDPFYRQSFPSGHAALFAYSGFFCIQYIKNRWQTHVFSACHVSKSIVMWAFFVTSALLSSTRYADNIHHPIDIAAGYILGAVVGIYVAPSAPQSLRDSNSNLVDGMVLMSQNV